MRTNVRSVVIASITLFGGLGWFLIVPHKASNALRDRARDHKPTPTSSDTSGSQSNDKWSRTEVASGPVDQSTVPDAPRPKHQDLLVLQNCVASSLDGSVDVMTLAQSLQNLARMAEVDNGTVYFQPLELTGRIASSPHGYVIKLNLPVSVSLSNRFASCSLAIICNLVKAGATEDQLQVKALLGPHWTHLISGYGTVVPIGSKVTFGRGGVSVAQITTELISPPTANATESIILDSEPTEPTHADLLPVLQDWFDLFKVR